MTPEAAAADFIFTKLRASAALVALIANVPEWGASVWPEDGPESDSWLPGVIFNQGEGSDVNAQDERTVVAIPFIVSCLAEGERFPHNIAAEVDAALHGATGVVGGYAITVNRLGGSRPIPGQTEKRRYRAVAQRFAVGLSPSL